MFASLPRAILAIVVAWTLSYSALAAAAPPLVVPPRPITAPAAPYPDGAHGDATVTLDVVVGRDGTITSGRVAEGEEPFASAALAAMPSWRFEPATRDGAPMAARIRVRIEFHPPAPPVASASASAPPPSPPPSAPAPSASTAPSSAPPAPPPEAPLDTVHVHMPPPPIGRTKLQADEIRELPGAFGEPARALESLPGVSPYASGLPFASVRGAMPSATAYTLDGMRLPAFFHYGLGVSTFHPALLESFDFFSGAAPAWSGRAFNLVAGETRAPALYPHAEATIRAFDSSALAETPLANGRGSVLVAGRYGYPGWIADALNTDVRLQYANYQARATWSFGSAGTITALLLGMRDVYGSHEGGYAGDLNTVDLWSHRLDLRYDADVGREGHARVGITFGDDEDAAYALRVRSVQGRAQIDAPIVKNVHARFGLDAYTSSLDIDLNAAKNLHLANAFTTLFLAGGGGTHRTSFGAWSDVAIRLGKGIELVPGVRVDAFDAAYLSGGRLNTSGFVYEQTKFTLDEPYVSPRLAVRAAILPGLSFVASGGMATIEPRLAFPIPTNDYLTGVRGHFVQSATTLDMGFQARLPGDAGVRAVAFQSSYRHMNLVPICVDAPNGKGDSDCDADGVARGVEVLVRRDLGHRLGGWLSYTLTFARMHNSLDADFADPLERRHQLSAVASYELGGGFRAGGQFVFYTGAPFATTSTYDANNKVEDAQIDPYAQRPSVFWRVDARLEKRWVLSPRTSVSVALEWLNATLSREPQIVCSIHSGPRKCIETTRPLLTAPSLTLSGQI
jgi:TonB family protein